jgi:hypothetical protein
LDTQSIVSSDVGSSMLADSGIELVFTDDEGHGMMDA